MNGVILPVACPSLAALIVIAPAAAAGRANLNRFGNPYVTSRRHFYDNVNI
jgi:hypothetical protein